jgi:hypothetical protein
VSMTLDVIGAGFGRTGTMSLKVALEKLGFGPCYHMSEVFAHPEHVESWRAAAQGKEVDWEQIFGGYRATVDWPACSFYGELMEKYPDAKVILTVRDPQRWYESAYNTIYTLWLCSSVSHWKCSTISATSTLRAIARFFGEWNCSQSLS